MKEREEKFKIYLKTNIYEIGREVKECDGGWPVKLRNRDGAQGMCMGGCQERRRRMRKPEK